MSNPSAEPERDTLQGNAFIVIPKGTVVTTDDPAFPQCVLQEDVEVCSNAKAKVRLFVPGER